MSDTKLFRLVDSSFQELHGAASDLEKPLQTLIEKNLEALLGVRFLASEYTTGKTHGGRIDTLGIDENNCPVILEYKRSIGENVINQGLFYLDWLMDHKAEFKLLVLERFDKQTADLIDWTSPRLICIAADFTKYDSHAVQQMNRNIDLIRYRQFGKELLLLELVNAASAKLVTLTKKGVVKPGTEEGIQGQTAEQAQHDPLASGSAKTRDLFSTIEAFILSLGDDIQRKDTTAYVAFKKIRNFTCVHLNKEKILLYLDLNPDDISLEKQFTRDVRKINHWGTGDLEIEVKDSSDIDKAKSLIQRAYVGEHGAS